MIKDVIFDLDGTLVQTERLKALSYAHAVIQLCPNGVTEAKVLEVFKEVVGLSRQEVATALMDQFGLEEAARANMVQLGADTPWQAFVQMRLRFYDAMLADPEVLRMNQWPHNVELLRMARQAGCKTALATMSHCEQVRHMLKVLDLREAFDFVATRDDVEYGKPDPEIYRLVARELETPAVECLVVEDSLFGVKAALAAGMWCIAVTTPFTRRRIHAERVLDAKWIVDDPGMLTAIVRRMVAEQNRHSLVS